MPATQDRPPCDPSVPVISGDELREVADAVVAIAVDPDAVSAAELEIGGAVGEDGPGDPAPMHAAVRASVRGHGGDVHGSVPRRTSPEEVVGLD